MSNNKQFFLLSILILMALIVAGNGPLPVQATAPTAQFAPGRLLVRLRPGAPAGTLERTLGRSSAVRVRTLYHSDVELWQVPEGQELAIAAQLNADPSVDYAEPDFVRHTLDTPPNDPGFANQWAHMLIDTPAAWDITTGSAQVVVAIVDTGIDEGHPDLNAQIVAGYDFVQNDSDPHDLNGHGTHVAGIVAAETNNSTGVAGMSWNARIMPVRTLGESGSGFDSDTAAGIVWAAEHGADIINLSLGGYESSQTLQDAINLAHAAGSLVVAAMGNNGVSTPAYPAACDNVLAVAATNSADVRASYSNFGPHCDVAAPGGYLDSYYDPDGIYSTMPTYPVYMTTLYHFLPNYDRLDGTSQAAPHVAGLAALLWSVNTGLSADQVQMLIEDTAADLGAEGWDTYYGHGRIDAFAAVQAAVPAVSSLRVTQAVTDATTLTAELRWDPPPGVVTVTLRYASSPITAANWGSAVLVDVLPGSSDTATAVVPYSGGVVYFALRPQFSDGTWAALSNNIFWPAQQMLMPLIVRNCCTLLVE